MDDRAGRRVAPELLWRGRVRHVVDRARAVVITEVRVDLVVALLDRERVRVLRDLQREHRRGRIGHVDDIDREVGDQRVALRRGLDELHVVAVAIAGALVVADLDGVRRVGGLDDVEAVAADHVRERPEHADVERDAIVPRGGSELAEQRDARALALAGIALGADQARGAHATRAAIAHGALGAQAAVGQAVRDAPGDHVGRTLALERGALEDLGVVDRAGIFGVAIDHDRGAALREVKAGGPDAHAGQEPAAIGTPAGQAAGRGRAEVSAGGERGGARRLELVTLRGDRDLGCVGSADGRIGHARRVVAAPEHADDDQDSCNAPHGRGALRGSAARASGPRSHGLCPARCRMCNDRAPCEEPGPRVTAPRVFPLGST